MAAEGAAAAGQLIAVIADEDTVTGLLLAGVGNVDARRKSNFFVVDNKTTTAQIEAKFKEYVNRSDVAIVLISQYIAEMIRHMVNDWTKPIPAILEIPSKEHPYDASKDSILARVGHLISADGTVAAI
jgi:V-type H+-transporting ATPase subunit F